ncbi:MAG: hypothetical protein R3B09_10740 [Nannocystaceae bacterium]
MLLEDLPGEPTLFTEAYRDRLDLHAARIYFGAETHARPALGDESIGARVLRAGAVRTWYGVQQGGALVAGPGEAGVIGEVDPFGTRVAAELREARARGWQIQAFAGLFAVVGLAGLIAPRRSGAALAGALRLLLLILAGYAMVVSYYGSAHTNWWGASAIAFGSFLVWFGWSMGSMPSGPTPLR